MLHKGPIRSDQVIETASCRTAAVNKLAIAAGIVSIVITSSDTTEGTAAPSIVVFDAANWNVPFTITVTGVNDDMDDGDIAYTILTAAAISGDPLYDTRNAADVSVTNIDNDTAGVSVVQSGGTTAVTEGGATDSFTVALASVLRSPEHSVRRVAAPTLRDQSVRVLVCVSVLVNVW